MTTTRETVLNHVYRLFYGDLSICGCGSPETAYDLVRDLLALAPGYRTSDEVHGLIGSGGVFHLVLGQLDGAGLITHGSSLGHSWLTPKGEWYLAALRTVTDWAEIENEEHFSIGFPHDGENCTDACWKVSISEEEAHGPVG